jgi:hypothetical protein
MVIKKFLLVYSQGRITFIFLVTNELKLSCYFNHHI